MSDFGDRIASEAKKFADAKVPYRHRGVTMRGCDCTGLLIGILNNMGLLKNYKLRKYKFDWNLHAGAIPIILDEILQYGDIVDTKEPGDVLVFRFGKCDAHCGIHVGNNQFIHSVVTAKCCQYGITVNSPWSKRLTKIVRPNEEKLRRLK